MTSSSPTAIVAIRPATEDDRDAILRLAALDSARVPDGDLLLGVVDGRPLAALSIATNRVVADPFAPTTDLVALLAQRADRLRAPAGRSRARLPLARRALRPRAS